MEGLLKVPRWDFRRAREDFPYCLPFTISFCRVACKEEVV